MICQGMGAAFGEMFRANAVVHAFCAPAWPHLAGACVAGLVSVVTYSRMAEEQEHVTHEEVMAAFELVVTATRERLQSAQLQFMRAEGNG